MSTQPAETWRTVLRASLLAARKKRDSTRAAARLPTAPRAATASGPPPFVRRWLSSPACWEMSDLRARVRACS